MSLPQLTINNQQLTINRRHCRRGFSLIELLVVIAIIGILASIGTVSFTNAQQKGRDARRKADLKTIQQALELYFQANGKYPKLSDWSVGWSGCPSQPWGHSGWDWVSGSPGPGCNSNPNFDLRAALLPYITNIPVDPINSDCNCVDNLAYNYNGNVGGLTYEIFANLENNNDPDRNCSSCAYAGYADYKVTNP